MITPKATPDAERLATLEEADPSLTPLLVSIVARFAKTPPHGYEPGRLNPTEEPTP